MKKTLFFIFLFGLLGTLSSQPSFDYATQPFSSEEPLGFVKYNTFTMVYTYNKSYDKFTSFGIHRHRVIGFNNDGSIRFDLLHSASGLSSKPWQCVPTHDKGMLTLRRIFTCFIGSFNSSTGFVYTSLSRIEDRKSVV